MKTDCFRCKGLCCVALAFDRSILFALDKPAGVPCPHLGPDDRCTIHEERGSLGWSGCIRYDCGGAGVRASSTTRRSWREGSDVARALFEAFRVERDIDEARELLDAARAFELGNDLESRRADLAARLHSTTWPTLASEIETFVGALRDHVRARQELVPLRRPSPPHKNDSATSPRRARPRS